MHFKSNNKTFCPHRCYRATEYNINVTEMLKKFAWEVTALKSCPWACFIYKQTPLLSFLLSKLFDAVVAFSILHRPSSVHCWLCTLVLFSRAIMRPSAKQTIWAQICPYLIISMKTRRESGIHSCHRTNWPKINIFESQVKIFEEWI